MAFSLWGAAMWVVLSSNDPAGVVVQSASCLEPTAANVVHLIDVELTAVDPDLQARLRATIKIDCIVNGARVAVTQDHTHTTIERTLDLQGYEASVHARVVALAAVELLGLLPQVSSAPPVSVSASKALPATQPEATTWATQLSLGTATFVRSGSLWGASVGEYAQARHWGAGMDLGLAANTAYLAPGELALKAYSLAAWVLYQQRWSAWSCAGALGARAAVTSVHASSPDITIEGKDGTGIWGGPAMQARLLRHMQRSYVGISLEAGDAVVAFSARSILGSQWSFAGPWFAANLVAGYSL